MNVTELRVVTKGASLLSLWVVGVGVPVLHLWEETVVKRVGIPTWSFLLNKSGPRRGTSFDSIFGEGTPPH